MPSTAPLLSPDPAEALSRAPGCVVVGYSGGMDSTALLHLLAGDPRMRARGLRAIHVHHGLHPDADRWVAHCAAACAALGVPLHVARVHVDRAAGLGLEGAARAARQRAFAHALADGGVLALAHHRDDQAETFLLRALRGSGVDGLAAMRPWRACGRGWMWRPLLDTPRAALHAHALALGLRWIDDPGNADTRHDRNFLRQRVLPLLMQRWPHAGDALARSAALAGDAADLLGSEDASALAAARVDRHTLLVDSLLAMPRARRARVLRHWIAALGLPPLSGNGIDHVERDLLAARADAQARFDWNGACVRRWRHLLHADVHRDGLPAGWTRAWDGSTPLALPGGGELALLGAPHFDAPLQLHARRGGERIVLPGRRHSHALKHVLQQASLPPWQRERMPLLSDGNELLAAGDATLSARMASWLQARGARLRWRHGAMP